MDLLGDKYVQLNVLSKENVITVTDLKCRYSLNRKYSLGRHFPEIIVLFIFKITNIKQ